MADASDASECGVNPLGPSIENAWYIREEQVAMSKAVPTRDDLGVMLGAAVRHRSQGD